MNSRQCTIDALQWSAMVNSRLLEQVARHGTALWETEIQKSYKGQTTTTSSVGYGNTAYLTQIKTHVVIGEENDQLRTRGQSYFAIGNSWLRKLISTQNCRILASKHTRRKRPTIR